MQHTIRIQSSFAFNSKITKNKTNQNESKDLHLIQVKLRFQRKQKKYSLKMFFYSDFQFAIVAVLLALAYSANAFVPVAYSTYAAPYAGYPLGYERYAYRSYSPYYAPAVYRSPIVAAAAS